MQKINPIPEGFHSVTPHIVVKDIQRASDFYKKAFGSEERRSIPGSDGKPMHAEIKIGNSVLMLMAENQKMGSRSPATLGGTPVVLALYVTDVDKSYKRAIDAGAKSIAPPKDMFWGDRYSQVSDLEGHIWSIAMHIKDPTPAVLSAAMKAECVTA